MSTASNVGGFAEVFKAKVIEDFQFRTLQGGTNITITQNANDLEISETTPGEVTLAANVGIGTGLIFRDKIGVTLNFKSLIGGTNITITNNADDITIDSTGGEVFTWTADHATGGNSLIFTDDASPPAGTVAAMYLEAGELNSNVATSNLHQWRINDVIEMSLDVGSLDLKGNNLLMSTGIILFSGSAQVIQDESGNLAIKSPTATSIELRINNVVEYEFDAAQADFKGNNLRNVGFIESNATNPGSTGVIRLGNNERLVWRNLANDNDDTVYIQNSKFTFQVGNTEFFHFDDTESVLRSQFKVKQVTQPVELTIWRDEIIADDSVLGNLVWEGLNTGENPIDYVKIIGTMESDVDASEDGSMKLAVVEAGVEDVVYMSLNDASSQIIGAFKPIDMNSNNITELPGTFVSALATVTAITGDFVMISDTSDSGNLKKVNASNFFEGEDNLGANVGIGAGLVFRDKIGVTLNFKSILAGSGITVNNNADDIEIVADLSTSRSILAVTYKDQTPSDLEFLSVVAKHNKEATEGFVQVVMPNSYTIQNVTMKIVTNPNVNVTDITLRKNGVNASPTIAVGAGLTGNFRDTVNTESVVFGDLMNYIVALNGGSGPTFQSSSLEVTPA